MKKQRAAEMFTQSMGIGMLKEWVSFAMVLLCGYLLSDMLECAMAGRWQNMYEKGGWLALALGLSLIPKYGLAVWHSKRKLTDIQNFREFLYQSILNRSLCVENQGQMEVRMNRDVQTIAEFFQETWPKALGGGTVLICSAVLLYREDRRIGSIFFLLNLVQLLPVFVYEKWTRDIYRQTSAHEEAYFNWMLEGYNGIRTIKAYGLENWYMKRYREKYHAIVRSGIVAEKASATELVIFQVIDCLLGYGSYVIIGLFVLYGGLNLEETPFLIVLGGYLFSSIQSVYDLRLQQFNYEEAWKRLQFKTPVSPHIEGTELLTIGNVSKAYGEKQILQKVSCVVERGDRILLQGENGSGKSTLLRIIMGVEEADQGEIIYGIPRKDWGVSLQEEPEWNLTGRELADAMAEAGSVDGKLLRRHIEQFQIQKLLEKPLSQLSPGERKKFYLAAALAHKGSVLILDEPTNHVDAASVSYLVKELRAYSGTLLVCTHKEDLDLKWTRTLVMKGGVCYESL